MILWTTAWSSAVTAAVQRQEKIVRARSGIKQRQNINSVDFKTQPKNRQLGGDD